MCIRDSSKIDTVSISSASVNKTYKKVKYDYILDLGRHEIGDHVTLTNDEDSVLNAVVVRLDEAVLSRTLQTLSEQPFTVDVYKRQHLQQIDYHLAACRGDGFKPPLGAGYSLLLLK